MKNIFTTCNGHAVPIANIDYVGKLTTRQLEDDNYTIGLKSGSIIRVSRARDYQTLYNCRINLLLQLDKLLENENK